MTGTKTCSLSGVVVLCLVLAYGVTFSYITILRHYAYLSTAYDLGDSEKLLWSTLNEGKFFITINGSSIFSEHFVPIWFVVLLFYALHQAPETLLVLQSFTLAAGAIPLFMLARREVGDEAGVGIATLYLLNPALHWINWFDFHTAALAVPFLFLAFFCLRTERYRSTVVFVLLAVCCAEYVALTVFGLGAYLIWIKRKNSQGDTVRRMSRQRWFLCAIVLLLIGLIWIPIAVMVIRVFSSSVVMASRYAWLGTGPMQILANLPATIPSVLKDPETIKYVYELLVPTLFLALSDIAVTLIPIGTLVFNLLSSFAPQHDIRFQYTAPILPFLYLATISAFRHVGRDATSHRRLLAIVLIAAVIQAQLYGPISTQGIPSRTTHDEVLDWAASLITQNASISTQNEILPHVARRSMVFLGYVDNAEYVLLDTTSYWYTDSPRGQPFREVLPHILGKYGVMVAIDGIVLLKAHYTGPLIYPDSRGLVARFYNNVNIQGEPVFEERVFTIGFDWGLLGSPFPTVNGRFFSATLEGWFMVESAGVYGFRLTSDDGSRLYVDGKLVIDGWGERAIDMSASIQLNRGSHSVRVEYVQYDLFDSLHLYISTPGQGYLVPPVGFFTAAP